ncbi:DUF4258 domain-containing protein [uncultured Gammaproteobacteria bacterium]
MNEFESSVIRRLMKDPGTRLIFSPHAERARMVERDVTENDVRTVLKKCRVSLVEWRGSALVWNAESNDIDGRPLRIPVMVNETNKLIVVRTVIDLTSNN